METKENPSFLNEVYGNPPTWRREMRWALATGAFGGVAAMLWRILFG